MVHHMHAASGGCWAARDRCRVCWYAAALGSRPHRDAAAKDQVGHWACARLCAVFEAAAYCGAVACISFFIAVSSMHQWHAACELAARNPVPLCLSFFPSTLRCTTHPLSARHTSLFV